MRNVDEYIQNNLNKSSQPHAYEIAEELWNLLEALQKKGFLREKLRGASGEKREVYLLAQKNADRILASFNKFFDLYMNSKKRQSFFDLTRAVGFTDEDLTHLLHTQLIFAFSLNMETLKNFLKLILTNKKPKSTLGDLFDQNKGILVKQTEETGEAMKISERLDIELRNSLVHFTFREEGALICCYNHVKEGEAWVLKENKIKSSDLLQKVQETSLIRALLASVITDWYGL